MRVSAFSMSFVIEPLTLIHVTIGMHELALAVRLVRMPVPLVAGAVWPHLLSIPISLVCYPLTSVCRPVLQCDRASLHSALIIILHSPHVLIVLVLEVHAPVGCLGVFVDEFIVRDLCASLHLPQVLILLLRSVPVPLAVVEARKGLPCKTLFHHRLILIVGLLDLGLLGVQDASAGCDTFWSIFASSAITCAISHLIYEYYILII